MFNKMQKKLCALAILAATSTSVMANSVDLTVVGTITPAACTPTLTGGGAIDYGTMRPSQLDPADGYTVLTMKEIDFAIACDAPARVAIKAINGRPGTVVGAAEGAGGFSVAPTGVSLFGAADAPTAGLGLDGTDKIGGFSLRIPNASVTLDGAAAADGLQRDAGAATWNTGSNGLLFGNTAVREMTWSAAAAAGAPGTFTNMAGKVQVQAFINKASELDLKKPIALDGMATIEVVYL
ncbi:DUF1120 domain-containing protein [Pantoea sp. GM01]|uniref:DUF1120 domain-containing protein n=1 Tax=Pantoea sp. GM01 TaxID=1144320 RepID=UPI00027125CE|nr:DUF1120 domain-containing protein [Pantoea sp. GM01]EJL85163.1 tryptophan synthase beta chain [Pantoea sp. GM01]